MLWWWMLACRGVVGEPGLTVEEVSSFVRPGAAEPEAWGRAVWAGLKAAERPIDPNHVCQVLAIIEQESGYEADPEVPGLAGIVEKELEEELDAKLGFLADRAASTILDAAPEGQSTTFRERLRQVRTEKDLDELFRAIVAHHEDRVPAIGVVVRAVAPKLEERLNPIRTAGSMQVNVIWAQAHEVSDGRPREEVRASMYEVEGGVLYGTLRLFETADYAEPIHRFADFNAGPYASRNAAFQHQLGQVSGTELVLDGDLLIYNGRGKPIRKQEGETYRTALQFAEQRGMDLGRVEKELAREKDARFERTSIWTAVRDASSAEAEPPYAMVPKVALDSPKLKGVWTTASFAGRVQRRYDDCLARR